MTSTTDRKATAMTVSLRKDDATEALARSLNNIRFWVERAQRNDRIELNPGHTGGPLIAVEEGNCSDLPSMRWDAKFNARIERVLHRMTF